MSNIIVIPARLESTRLPRKLLLAETGKSVLQHTYEQAIKSKLVDQVWIAWDEIELYYEAVKFCPNVILTGRHSCGTDRVAEVVRLDNFHSDDIVVNIQADEPEIDPEHIDLLFRFMLESPAVMATLATKIGSTDFQNDSCVKVVFDKDGKALYFSRFPIPFGSDHGFRHIGVYAYRSEFLLLYSGLPTCWLEVSERLEQLRVLDAGFDIYVILVDEPHVGIDTRADYDAFVARQGRELII